MTREEHLVFCKKCTNRKMNMQTGIVCSLTDRIADFEKECTSFQLDETVTENLNNTDPVEHAQVIHTLSEEDLSKLKTEQQYPKALIAGLIVGIIGAMAWGAITVATEYQIGYMAIAIGAGIGLAMRYFGKGIDQIFGITGAIIAVISCLLGNFFSIVGFIASSESLGYLETLSSFNYSLLFPIMSETFSPMDIIFYAIAAYEGYKFSFRVFTEEDLQAISQK